MALRPMQWTKNAVVVAAFFFAYWDHLRGQPIAAADLLIAIPAFVCFCLLSSAVYVLNDIKDVEADRNHPEKKFRPIAAGRISRGRAGILGALLLLGACTGSWFLSREYAMVAAAYAVMQVIYTLWLKKIALVDVFVIAAGFVLRAVAGAELIKGAVISPWLLLCTFLLALFLALCKRRHEKVVVSETADLSRPTLQNYSQQLLDQLIAIAAGSTVVCYAMYTLSPTTVEKFHTSALGFTVPFVVFGIFRYLDLVYRHEKGGRPEKILLTDIPMLANLVLYGAAVLVIFLVTR
ncbi:MAG: decaprenyl-phosphate phosphoribosyltransferase [Verrucomicrobia bacterium]|nr:decaprenyl-phosphate phosphoribosyltransferase [Verrucomicrobiota bacterium]